ncbi:hypothetical protein DL767_006484 [Monosporascus sp. MG133]|nr:hypothetical protein DL767_006484 [Monosporascus sp. MG133]
MSGVDIASLPPEQQEQILNSPSLPAPDGVVPNFDDPPNNNVVAHVLFPIWLALITVALVGRLYTRHFYMKRLSIGDYLLMFAYAVLLADFGLCYRMTAFPGIFVHQWDVRLGDFINFLKFVFISSQVYIFAIVPIKVAILLEWLRIFVPRGTRNLVFWTSHILIWTNVIFYLSIVVALNVACTPYEYNWNILLQGSCERVDTKDTNLSASVFNFLSDVLILLIPQRTIWKLQMTTNRKIGISIIFAIGLLGCGAALARLVETVLHATSPDFTYTFSAVMLCSGAELTCGFLIICIPCFPQAFGAIEFSKLTKKLSFRTSLEKLRPSKQSSTENSWSHQGRFATSKPVSKHTDIDEHVLLPVSKSHPEGPGEQQLYENMGRAERGIIRTTEFEALEDYNSNPTNPNSEYSRQHPWV